MKHIRKGEEPRELAEFKACANNDWQPSFHNLDKETKKAIKSALIAEQGYICCYCEREISDKDSHIEHFKPRSRYSDEALAYNNLLCSCQRNLNKA